ncbi:rhodanese homology domain-containing protein [Comamonas endophytica]|uniref:Rhodanese homology domain-containing protein n=1 Tax=Comamonas endophytica TaxID=2949090 RepID=A0ABY6GD76_9BURK|nr:MULTISPECIES: rhodanese homology domain-containing protein [unclassified Acidovorax]MCD2513740.1 rhodanese homology domain-containing protein [Acidovorax sp. D4N7]UYG52255.1 rhodanese homology domain-containing protein [Acidovorax sp. 5MLIR]
MSNSTPQLTPEDIRQALMAGEEIALLDVREEAPFAEGHPLWAANLPAGRIEIDAWQRLPRRDTRIAVYDNGEGLAEVAAQRLQALGYTQVHVLAGGLAGWENAGYELFIDVNVPSKAFGEWLEAERHTPSLAAEEVKELLDRKADVVVLDARRFDEYQTMSIPGGVSVPGAELVLRAATLAPDPSTHIVVNCAGRTRSLIGAQSLVNAGLPNRITALRNGTIGWLLAGQQLEHGADRRAPEVQEEQRAQAAERARAVADRAGVRRASRDQLQQFTDELTRTTYFFDVRSAEEFAAGHLAGFRNYPGGQLVQETDHAAPVRGARIVLADDDGVRASMTASWLAQMGWEAWVLDGVGADDWNETGQPASVHPEPAGAVQDITAQTLAGWLEGGDGKPATALLDFTGSANYVKRHIPGAWFALRSQLAQAVENIPKAERYVVTCGTSLLARFAAKELADITGAPVYALAGGTQAWIAEGLPLEEGETRLASPRIDRYRRPYEGTEAPHSAMQAYLDWEFGLVDQLKRDGTHHFQTV